MVKLLLESTSHPSGADSSGAMPIGGPWAETAAAKERAAKMLVVRIVKAGGGYCGGIDGAAGRNLLVANGELRISYVEYAAVEEETAAVDECAKTRGREEVGRVGLNCWCYQCRQQGRRNGQPGVPVNPRPSGDGRGQTGPNNNRAPENRLL